MRERILFVVQIQGDPKGIANLNIFLNALGLDASQLASSQSDLVPDVCCGELIKINQYTI